MMLLLVGQKIKLYKRKKIKPNIFYNSFKSNDKGTNNLYKFVHIG